jgi:hypothetical protein
MRIYPLLQAAGILILTPPALPQENPLAGPTGPDFQGVFEGDGLKIELARQGAAYVGSFHFEGNMFPATASTRGSQLNGSFRSGTYSFPFTASRQGYVLRVLQKGNGSC